MRFGRRNTLSAVSGTTLSTEGGQRQQTGWEIGNKTKGYVTAEPDTTRRQHVHNCLTT